MRVVAFTSIAVVCLSIAMPTAILADESSRSIDINELDDYTQWKQALDASEGTDPATFLVPEGFQIERLRSAAEDEGSWVSMAFDPQGRLVIAREERGLLRMTLSTDEQPMQVDVIDDTLLECRGLLFAFDSLYVNANNSKGLYRLRDTDGDDQFDERTLLYESSGGVGHGRNDLTLGPDGMIYSIHGDAVDLPTGSADATSPFTEHRRGQTTREGHVIRLDRDGKQIEIFAAGLRNPYGIDFNADGEAFTYDADAEFDMGSPWYRPTRVVHLVRGADYGWRGVTGSWPPYYPDHPDNAPPALDIGKGSPTSVKFGTRSNFPPPLRDALFILDWAYGRIVAVHMSSRGASYDCRAETFLKGRPLNVTDLDFGPDGAMYFVTGGRKTQSALYRVRSVGPKVVLAEPSDEQLAKRNQAAEARRLRHRLEDKCSAGNSRTVEFVWSYLAHDDPRIRYAARTALEHQPIEAWRERAMRESDQARAIVALMALARSGEPANIREVAARVCELPLRELATDDLSAALYTMQLCLSEQDDIDPAVLERFIEQGDALYPHQAAPVNQQLSSLLVKLAAPNATTKTLQLLSKSTNQSEQMHYLFALRSARRWTPDERLSFAAALRGMASFQGGEGMPKFRQQIRSDWLNGMSSLERDKFEPLLEDRAPSFSEPISRPFVQAWRLEDLLTLLPEMGKGRDLQRGEAMFAAALCVRCHRIGLDGGVIGPDLTAVARRFSRRDILESILTPSKVVAEQYGTARIITNDGRVLTGQILPSTDYRSPSLQIAVNPMQPGEIVEILKSDIESHEISPLSTMPKGLLNTLTRDEVLDLLAYVEGGGHIDGAR